MFIAFRRALLFFTGATVPISTVHIVTLGPMPFTLNKLVTAGLLLLVMMETATSRRSMPRNAKNFWIAALGASMGIGMVMSFFKTPNVPLLINAATGILSLLLFYYLLLYALASFRDLDALLAGLIVGVVLTAVTVLFGYNPSPEALERTGGLRGDANGYSFIASITIPLVALYYFLATSRMRKLVLVVLGFVIFQGIITSLSRTGLVATTGAFLLWVLRFRRFDVLRYAVPGAVIVAVVVAISAPEWRERISTMTSAEARAADGSIQSRVVQYSVSLRAFASSPLVGIGYRDYERWATEQRVDPGALVIHNAYLHVMAELGLMGLLPFLVILLLTWRDFSRAWRMTRRENVRGDPELQRLYLYAVFLQVGFFAALLGNFFLDSLRYRESWILYASSTAVLGFVRARIAVLEAEQPEVSTLWHGSDALSGAYSADGTPAA